MIRYYHLHWVVTGTAVTWIPNVTLLNFNHNRRLNFVVKIYQWKANPGLLNCRISARKSEWVILRVCLICRSRYRYYVYHQTDLIKGPIKSVSIVHWIWWFFITDYILHLLLCVHIYVAALNYVINIGQIHRFLFTARWTLDSCSSSVPTASSAPDWPPVLHPTPLLRT